MLRSVSKSVWSVGSLQWWGGSVSQPQCYPRYVDLLILSVSDSMYILQRSVIMAIVIFKVYLFAGAQLVVGGFCVVV